MAPIETTQRTAGQRLADSPAVAEAIDAMLGELREAQAGITAARPPRDELRQTYEQALARLGETRGRPPIYSYLGSGIGNGPLVELADGSVKWDMINGIGVHMFGHSDPDTVAAALRASLSDTIMQGNLQCNHEVTEFAELIIGEASRTSDLRYCFLTNSGAMANESALKVCLQKNAPAKRVLAFSRTFCGRSTTMAQLTDNPANRVGIPLTVLVDYVPFYDPSDHDRSIHDSCQQLEQYLKRYPDQHSCFLMELVQGEGGFNVGAPEFLRPLMQMCRDHGVGVWADEVQTFGRTNTMFAFEHLGVGDLVDVATFGKMSQVCGCLYTPEYNPQPGLLSGTFIGSTVGLSTGAHMLQRLRDGGYYGEDGKIAKLFQTFRSHAEKLVRKHPSWFPELGPTGRSGGDHRVFGGIGGMMRFTPFGGEKQAVLALLKHMFELGVVAFYCGHGPFHVRFLPPVGVMKPEQFEDVFQITEQALAATAAELNLG